jgi:hypothetical protein
VRGKRGRKTNEWMRERKRSKERRKRKRERERGVTERSIDSEVQENLRWIHSLPSLSKVAAASHM